MKLYDFMMLIRLDISISPVQFFFERENTQSINQSRCPCCKLKNVPTEWYIIEWDVKQSTLSSRSSPVLYQMS